MYMHLDIYGLLYIYIGLLYIYKPVICHNMFIIYHLVISHGKWPIEIDGLPINSMVDLSMAMLVITRW